jgi:16S rRNA processing protein RimM
MKSVQSQHLEQPAGSPGKGEPVFLVIGKLRRPHGVHGEIIMDVLTDFPERLKKNLVVFVGQDHRPETIRSLRQHGAALLVTFQNYQTPETIGVMRNELVYVRADDRPPLEEGEYYHHELLGLRVVDESERLLGTLIRILDTGANDVYVVRPQDGPEILLPAIESVILDINLEQGEIRVHLLPGLIAD